MTGQTIPDDIERWEKKGLREDIGSDSEHVHDIYVWHNFAIEHETYDCDDGYRGKGHWNPYVLVDGRPLKLDKCYFDSFDEAVGFLKGALKDKALTDSKKEKDEEENECDIPMHPSSENVARKSMVSMKARMARMAGDPDWKEMWQNEIEGMEKARKNAKQKAEAAERRKEAAEAAEEEARRESAREKMIQENREKREKEPPEAKPTREEIIANIAAEKQAAIAEDAAQAELAEKRARDLAEADALEERSKWLDRTTAGMSPEYKKFLYDNPDFLQFVELKKDFADFFDDEGHIVISNKEMDPEQRSFLLGLESVWDLMMDNPSKVDEIAQSDLAKRVKELGAKYAEARQDNKIIPGSKTNNDAPDRRGMDTGDRTSIENVTDPEKAEEYYKPPYRSPDAYEDIHANSLRAQSKMDSGVSDLEVASIIDEMIRDVRADEYNKGSPSLSRIETYKKVAGLLDAYAENAYRILAKDGTPIHNEEALARFKETLTHMKLRALESILGDRESAELHKILDDATRWSSRSELAGNPGGNFEREAEAAPTTADSLESWLSAQSANMMLNWDKIVGIFGGDEEAASEFFRDYYSTIALDRKIRDAKKTLSNGTFNSLEPAREGDEAPIELTPDDMSPEAWETHLRRQEAKERRDADKPTSEYPPSEYPDVNSPSALPPSTGRSLNDRIATLLGARRSWGARQHSNPFAITGGMRSAGAPGNGTTIDLSRFLKHIRPNRGMHDYIKSRDYRFNDKTNKWEDPADFVDANIYDATGGVWNAYPAGKQVQKFRYDTLAKMMGEYAKMQNAQNETAPNKSSKLSTPSGDDFSFTNDDVLDLSPAQLRQLVASTYGAPEMEKVIDPATLKPKVLYDTEGKPTGIAMRPTSNLIRPQELNGGVPIVGGINYGLYKKGGNVYRPLLQKTDDGKWHYNYAALSMFANPEDKLDYIQTGITRDKDAPWAFRYGGVASNRNPSLAGTDRFDPYATGLERVPTADLVLDTLARAGNDIRNYKPAKAAIDEIIASSRDAYNQFAKDSDESWVNHGKSWEEAMGFTNTVGGNAIVDPERLNAWGEDMARKEHVRQKMNAIEPMLMHFYDNTPQRTMIELIEKNPVLARNMAMTDSDRFDYYSGLNDPVFIEQRKQAGAFRKYYDPYNEWKHFISVPMTQPTYTDASARERNDLGNAGKNVPKKTRTPKEALFNWFDKVGRLYNGSSNDNYIPSQEKLASYIADMADDDALSADTQRMLYWMNDPDSIDESVFGAPLPEPEKAPEAETPEPIQGPAPVAEAPEKKPVKPKTPKAPKAPETEAPAPEPVATGTPKEESEPAEPAKPVKKGISMRDRIRYFDPTFDTGMNKSEGGKKMEEDAMPSRRGDSEPRKMAYRTVTMGEGKDPIPMTVVDAKTGKVLFRLD